MKKVFAGVLFLFCLMGATNTLAGENLAGLEWSASNIYLAELGDTTYYVNYVVLDIGVSGQFYTANGVLETADGSSFTCVGTGYRSSTSNDVVIGLSCGAHNAQIIVDSGTLSGEMAIINSDGGEISAGRLTFNRFY